MLNDPEQPMPESTITRGRPETIARVRNAGRPGERRWMDLVSLVEEAIDDMGESAADAGVGLAFMWTVPGVVKADRNAFVGALRSLLSVSIDATERGGRVGVHLYGLESMVLEVRYGRRKLVSEMRSPRWHEALDRCRRQVEPMGGTVVVDDEGGSPAAVKLDIPFA